MDTTTTKMVSSRTSRRIQRRHMFKRIAKIQKQISKRERTHTIEVYNNIINTTTRHCFKSYGYHSNPNTPPWYRTKTILENMPPCIYFNRPSTLSYHNLCPTEDTTTTPPPGITSLLGLGSKFCIQNRSIPTNITHTMTKFKRDVRTHFFFKDDINEEKLENNNSKLYVKNTKWAPPLAKPEIELRRTNFENELTKAIHEKTLRHNYSSNISRVQEHAIKTLKNNEDFIITLTDKNLGPAILRREQYIKMIYDEHLSDSQTYQRKDATETISELQTIHKKLISLIYKFKDTLPATDFQYISNEPSLNRHSIPTESRNSMVCLKYTRKES